MTNRIEINRISSILFEDILKSKETEINLSELIISYLRSEKYSELEALEKSVKMVQNIKRIMKKKHKENKQLGVISPFIFDDVNDDKLYILTNISGSFIDDNTKRIIKYHPIIKKTIRDLNWREFEGFCKLILEANEVKECIVTRSSKEGGIDAYGWLEGENSNMNTRIWPEIKLRIICQGKHKSGKSKVSSNEISEFSLDMEQIRAQNVSSKVILPFKFSNSSMPLLPIFITNGEYERKAKIFAEKKHIIIWQGDQISQDLINHPSFDKWLNKNKTLSSSKLKKYLEKIISKK